MVIQLHTETVIQVILLITLTTPLTSALTLRSTEHNFESDAAKMLIKLSKSADIKSYMDTNMDPCDDFYTYACGTWKRINPAQWSSEKKTDHLGITTMGIDRKFQNFLLTNKTGNNTVEDKIKNFYASCLNAKVDNAKYRLALENVLSEFGQFSVLKTSEKKSETKWWITVAEIKKKYGIAIILTANILVDIKDKSKRMVFIQAPDFQNYLRTDEEEKIRKFLKLYFNVQERDATRLAKEILNFEDDLMPPQIPEHQTIENRYTLYNTSDLSLNYKGLLNLQEFLEIALGTKDLPKKVYVYDEFYLKHLLDIYESINAEQMENYILWQFMDKYLIDIERKDLQQMCLFNTKKYFAEYIDRSIYNQYRSKEMENEIYELWHDIKSIFQHDLESDQKYYWMSNATRQYAIEKLNKMNLSINSYDHVNLIEQYKTLDIDPSNFVLNIQNILKHQEALRGVEPDNNAALLSHTPVYIGRKNHISIPVAFLQPYYIFDRNYPQAIKYSTVGFAIAHEILHGFDDSGRTFDANGNINNWWDEQSSSEFEKRRKCFQQQFNNFSYYGIRLPDTDFQGENIADSGAINLAYNSYVRWLEKRKQSQSQVEVNETLPRLNFTNHQLFFITYAQFWCEDIHSEYRSIYYEGEVHAPGMYRVITPLSNFPPFSQIFKCSEHSSRMNPPKRCEIY